MELKQAYEVMSRNCGIEKGDTVKVLRTAKEGEMGWCNVWVPSMNNYIGNEYTVIDVDRDYNSGIELGSNYMRFPFYVLELVKKASKIITRYFNENGEDITDKISDETKKNLQEN